VRIVRNCRPLPMGLFEVLCIRGRAQTAAQPIHAIVQASFVNSSAVVWREAIVNFQSLTESGYVFSESRSCATELRRNPHY
jgi:hypothetical protein